MIKRLQALSGYSTIPGDVLQRHLQGISTHCRTVEVEGFIQLGDVGGIPSRLVEEKVGEADHR